MDAAHADVQPRTQEALQNAKSPVTTWRPDSIDHNDRDAFSLRLQHHFHQHAVNETPFILIAMRGDHEEASPLDFSLFSSCAHKLLNDQDDCLVDVDKKRLIVLMLHSHAEDARRFFARLKVRLFEAAPQRAESYLYAISAITLPNGAPFQTAEDFLMVALEEE